MSSGDNMVLKGKANAFMIWRAGNAVGWDCTARDIADETGISQSTIRKVCKAKGWELVDARHMPEKWDVCRHIAHNGTE